MLEYPALSCSSNLPPQGSLRARPPFSKSCEIFVGNLLISFVNLQSFLDISRYFEVFSVVFFRPIGCLVKALSLLKKKLFYVNSILTCFPYLLDFLCSLSPSFLFGCLNRLNNSPNCPNSLVAHQIHFVLPWASQSTNQSGCRRSQPIREQEAMEPANQRRGCHLPTQTAAISLKLV